MGNQTAGKTNFHLPFVGFVIFVNDKKLEYNNVLGTNVRKKQGNLFSEIIKMKKYNGIVLIWKH